MTLTAFTVSMLLVTWLHWSRYSLDHVPFLLWFGLYLVTPVIVPALWAINRRTDPLKPEKSDAVVPLPVRAIVGLFGAGLAVVVIATFIAPDLLMAFWPWHLTELTAHLLAGWGALLAVSNMYVAFEPRWSTWRIGVQSIALWHLLYLGAALANPEDFTAGLLNWHVISVTAILVAMAVLYVVMDKRCRTANKAERPDARCGFEQERLLFGLHHARSTIAKCMKKQHREATLLAASRKTRVTEHT